MASNEELGEFEWEKHRPSWGEIPVARRDHFAFVHDKKMFIMGGETVGAPPDGVTANNIPYLDLTSWTWGRQKLTGTAPSTGFLRANCHYQQSENVVKVTLGPRWEAGSYMVIDIYTLDLTTYAWTSVGPRGRWNINWKMDLTVWCPCSQKLVQFGRHPLSNFNDSLVSGVMHHSALGWNTWYDLGTSEKDSQCIGAVVANDKLSAIWYNEKKNSTTWASYDAMASGTTRVVASGIVERAGGEYLATVMVGKNMLFFDTQILSADRVSFLRTDALASSCGTEQRFIKSTTRAPQKQRIGTSVVHYDGYLIFFGGALSKDLGAKLSNEVYVLSIGSHNSIESVLDSMAVADAAIKAAEGEADSEATTLVEISTKKSKKSAKNLKKVSFDPDPVASSSSTSEATPSASSSSPKGNNDASDLTKAEEAAPSDSPSPSPAVEVADSQASKAILEISGALSNVKVEDTSLGSTDVAPKTQDLSPKPLEPLWTPEERVLKWLEGNQTNTAKLLEYAVNNPDCYPDMAFKVNGEIFWAHKAIIAARSSRWRQHLDPQKKAKYSSPSSARRASSDFEDSELDVSNESAAPREPRGGSPSPFMFGKLGASAIDLMLDEEEDTRPKFEMTPLPLRYSSLDQHPFFGGAPAAPNAPNAPNASANASGAMASSSSSIPVTTTGSSSDSITSSVSSSGIAPPAKSVPVYTLEDLEKAAFRKVLTYMYTGAISVTGGECEAVADVAHEFLLDDVSALCREKIAKTWVESPVKQSRLLRRLVGSPLGSDYFFVVRHKKLFAHRFAIFLFSAHFRQIMLSRSEKAYMEVREIEDFDIATEVFIDFCRMMYCNFTSLPEHAEKKMDTSNLSRLATEWKEYRCLRLIRSTKPDAKSTLELYRLAQTNPDLIRDVRKTIMLHFGKFAQDKSSIKKLSRAEQFSWLDLGERGGANWLDKLWFAHCVGDASLLAEAETALGSLINVENVLPVLFGAHQVGVKPLRSLCMDFMSAHSTSIEDARRMQVDAPVALGKVGSLSASVNQELSSKIAGATSSARIPQQKVKSCGLCAKTFSTFGKKNNCILCHKTACGDCTKKKVTIPPIFGISKPRDICTSCAQVVDLWSDPGNQSASPK